MPSTRAKAPAAGKPATGRRPLKNPLRTPAIGATAPSSFPAFDDEPSSVPGVSGPQLRKMAISEFAQWLRTQTNKNKLPFQERAIESYAETARVLDRWMTGQGIDGDFSTCDTDVLNRFFADYRNAHTQGGTNTRQRNLHHMFKWLAKAYDHPDPWTDDLVRYGPAEVPPSTLAREVIQDLLELTSNGKPARFEDIRDHAIIRMLTEAVRREELAQMETGDLPENLIASPFVRVVPLKGARASSQGRLVPLSLVTARALAAYLRIRRSHRHADLPALWLGSRNRGPLTASGVYQMLHRRALQAGYEPIVRPHQFRHILSALFPCRDCCHRWVSGPAACAVPLPLPRCRLSRNRVRRVSLQQGRPTATRVPPNTASAERSHTFALPVSTAAGPRVT